ncbi:LOG family protein [Methanosphaera sp.]
MKICLYGAGSKFIDEKYINAGYELGEKIVANGHSLVFGGGNDGMMGAVARGVFDNHGHILAISPEWMDDFEELYENCDNRIHTKTMTERKDLFIKESDAIIIAPGGIGTLDEFFEAITLKKLGRMSLPIIIFNIDGYYDTMINMLNFMIDEKTISASDRNLYDIAVNVDDIFNILD